MPYFEARKSFFGLHTTITVCDDMAHMRHSLSDVPIVRTYCVPDMCAYHDGARRLHDSKVFILGALWVNLNSAIKIIKIVKNLKKSKIEKF